MARAPALVDAVPVGMDARHDVPFWPHICYMTSREMWVVPAARMLALVAALHGTPQPGPAVSLRATPAGDEVRIGLAGTPAGRGDLRMSGHNIAFAAASRPRAGQPVWTGRPVDPSRAWVAQLETADGMFVADIVGGPGIRHDAATGS